MPDYKLLINGRNFLLEIENKKRKMGFYQTVFVSSPDSAQVELDAVAIVRDNSELRAIALNDQSDPPMIFVEKICEVEIAEVSEPRFSATERAFYLERKWWQVWK